MTINAKQIRELQEKRAVDPAIVRGVLSRVPPAWSLIKTAEDGGFFQRGSVYVAVTVAYEEDHRIWVHVSLSCKHRIPPWDELKRVKHDFIGPDRWAYQVLPSEKQYVNIHPFVLHLFALLDGEPALPDFTEYLRKAPALRHGDIRRFAA